MAHYLIAQVNGGQYRNHSHPLTAGSPSCRRDQPSCSYGNGWELATLGGRRFREPGRGHRQLPGLDVLRPQGAGRRLRRRQRDECIGRSVVATNSATFAAITTRGIAGSVLSLAANQPLPNQGMGIERISLIYGLLVLALTGMLVLALARMPRRYRQLAQRERAVDRAGAVQRPDCGPALRLASSALLSGARAARVEGLVPGSSLT